MNHHLFGKKCYSTLAAVVCMCIVAVNCSGMCGCESRFSILMEFYNATNGSGWLSNSGWGQTLSSSACDTPWHGVVCNGTDVIRLSLDSNQLYGTIPSSLGNLSLLQSVRLRNNSLVGTLPPSLGNLVQLTYLNLRSNNLQGSLPESWRQLGRLAFLNLRSNGFVGSLPSSWSSMTSLTQKMNLRSNALNGSLPDSWAALTKLTLLNLRSNKFTGSLPSSWGNMTQMKTLRLEDNALNGTLPSSWSTMASLATLHLNDNSISGSLPSDWSAFTLMDSLHLSSNDLTGTLSSAWQSMTKLTDLNLRSNSFTGTVPSVWSNMTFLQNLNLRSNYLNGSLPDSWSSLTKLNRLSIRSNDLTGSLPTSWSAMIAMSDLNMRSNGFTGSLPDEWSHMFNVFTLELQENSLAGAIPTSWENLTKLTTLQLNTNNISGTLPPQLSTLTVLDKLHLFENALLGSLPTEWSAMTSLTDLNLRSNAFTGSLPEAWGNMTNLQVLNLRSNSLTGSLPSSWGAMAAIKELNLRSNTFTGTLPDSWSALVNLSTLELDENALVGTLPSSWANMTSLVTLQLNSNSFSGPLPNAWSRFGVLEVLHLSDNKLTGSLPAVWGNDGLAQITSLHLSNNNFTGATLPSSWFNMTELETLHISNCSLIGPLPVSWLGLTNLKDLHMGSNKLNGSLPEGWGAAFTILEVVNLGDNLLQGSLPSSWGAVTNLQELHLNNNQLNDTLPVAWGQMASMEELDLSANQLTGLLPSSWGNMTKLVELLLDENCLEGFVPEPFASLMTQADVSFCQTRVHSEYNRTLNCSGASGWPSYCHYSMSTAESHTQTNTTSLSYPASRSISANNSSATLLRHDALSNSTTPTMDTTCSKTISSTFTPTVSRSTLMSLGSLTPSQSAMLSASSSIASSTAATSESMIGTTTRTISSTNITLTPPSLSISLPPTTSNKTASLSTSHTISTARTCPQLFDVKFLPNTSAQLQCYDNSSAVQPSSSSSAAPLLHCVQTPIELEPRVDNNTSGPPSSLVLIAHQLPSSSASTPPLVIVVSVVVPSSWAAALGIGNSTANTNETTLVTCVEVTSDGTRELIVNSTTAVCNISHVLQQSPLYGSVTNFTISSTCLESGPTATVMIAVLWPLSPPSTPSMTLLSASTDGVVSTTTALSLASSADIGSAVSVALLSLLTCSDKPPVSTTSYFVSVFFELGNIAVAFGNIGLAMFVLVIHSGVVWMVHRRRHHHQGSDKYLEQSSSNVDDAAVLSLAGRAEIYLTAMATCRFPSWSVKVICLLLPGCVMGAVASIVKHATPGDAFGGVVALLCAIGVLIGLLGVQRFVIVPLAPYIQYNHYCVGTAFEKRFLFPEARWEPSEMRASFNPLLTQMREGPYISLVVVEILLSCFVGAVAGTYVGGACHTPMLPLAAVLHFSYCIVIVVLRPYRLPINRVLAPLSYFLLGLICALQYADPDTSPTVPQMLMSAVQMIRSLTTFYIVMFRERSLVMGDPWTREARDDFSKQFLNNGDDNDDGPSHYFDQAASVNSSLHTMTQELDDFVIVTSQSHSIGDEKMPVPNASTTTNTAVASIIGDKSGGQLRDEHFWNANGTAKKSRNGGVNNDYETEEEEFVGPLRTLGADDADKRDDDYEDPL